MNSSAGSDQIRVPVCLTRDCQFAACLTEVLLASSCLPVAHALPMPLGGPLLA